MDKYKNVNNYIFLIGYRFVFGDFYQVTKYGHVEQAINSLGKYYEVIRMTFEYFKHNI